MSLTVIIVLLLYCCQWRSQSLKSGWAQEVWGTEVSQRGPGAESRWGSAGEAPRSQIYTNYLQLSNVFLRRFVAESVLHLPLHSPSPQKTIRICVNPMTQHGRDRVGTCSPVPTRGYATDCCYLINTNMSSCSWLVVFVFIYGSSCSDYLRALANLGQSVVCVKIWRTSTPMGRNIVSRKMQFGWVQTHIQYSVVSGPKFTGLFIERGRNRSRSVSVFRFWISWPVPEIFAIEVWNRAEFCMFLTPNFLGGGVDPEFLDRLRSCGKVSRRSAEGARR